MKREWVGMMREWDLIGKGDLNKEERGLGGERCFFVEIHCISVILCIFIS
ncbi:hypothetical protein [Bacillus pumilus]|nr:hypothetical protein [Bacillus pumilus]